MTTTLDELQNGNGGYYDRTDTSKNYDKHLFIAGRILQSAEVNEIQTSAQNQLKSIADALFKDGDIVRDARAVVDELTGKATLESGAVYLRGQVRGVPEATFTVDRTGTVVIGVWLVEEVITETDDETLLDPASATRGYNEPGAYRLRLTPQWGVQTDNVSNAEFTPIYYVDDGQLRAKEPPPNLDAVTQAIARYDVDSNGSNYVVSGMRVSRMDDDSDGNQVFNIDAGRARVNGFGISLNASRRNLWKATPDLKAIDSEPATSATAESQRVNLVRSPVSEISEVHITTETTEDINHGNSVGAMDPISASSVLKIISVVQGETTYVDGTDYKLTEGKVDWSLGGAEPALGSTYTVTYQHIIAVEPENPDEKGFNVTGAVPGTIITTSYTFKLPRIDRLVVDETGEFKWIIGVATDYNPVPPPVPSNVLAICQMVQKWTSESYLINDGVRMVPMSSLEALSTQLAKVTDMVAQLNLVSDINVRQSIEKKGLFVDPFTGDEQRDQGLEQTAAIAGGALQLAIKGAPLPMGTDVTGTMSCDFEEEVVLANTARTSQMQVNPYMAFGIFPSAVTLTPALDRWVETKTNWLSSETRYFTTTVYAPWTSAYGVHATTAKTGEEVVNELASTSTSDAEFLRPITVSFVINGFGAGEALSQVLFDGIDVTPTGAS